jgi:hypothetical protein
MYLVKIFSAISENPLFLRYTIVEIEVQYYRESSSKPDNTEAVFIWPDTQSEKALSIQLKSHVY